MAEPGTFKIIEVEFKNSSEYNWDKGFYLQQLKPPGHNSLNVPNVVMETELKSMESFKLNVPLEIAQDASQGDYEVFVQFAKPDGTVFGEALKLLIKVEGGADE